MLTFLALIWAVSFCRVSIESGDRVILKKIFPCDFQLFCKLHSNWCNRIWQWLKIGDYRFLLFLAVFFLFCRWWIFVSPGSVLVPRYFFTSLIGVIFLFPSCCFEAEIMLLSDFRIFCFGLFFIHQVWMLISINSSINTGMQRRNGWGWLPFGCFFCCVLYWFKNKPNSWQWISRAGFLALMIFTFYGAKQLFPLVVDYFRKGTPIVIDLNISSSLSNKIFFAEVITLFCLFSLLTSEKNRKWMILAWTGVFICLVWIILLQTISSWLAVIVGFIVLLILSRYSVSSNKAPEQLLG